MEGFTNVFDGRGFVGIELFHQSDLFGGEGFSPAAPASPASGRGKPGLGALADDVALELRKGAEDVEDELPAAGRGVDLLGEALEADAAAVKLCDGLDKVLEGAAEAIQAPHHKGVPFPRVHASILFIPTIGLPATLRSPFSRGEAGSGSRNLSEIGSRHRIAGLHA